jgi:hypothetical protein
VKEKGARGSGGPSFTSGEIPGTNENESFLSKWSTCPPLVQMILLSSCIYKVNHYFRKVKGGVIYLRIVDLSTGREFEQFSELFILSEQMFGMVLAYPVLAWYLLRARAFLI